MHLLPPWSVNWLWLFKAGFPTIRTCSTLQQIAKLNPNEITSFCVGKTIQFGLNRARNETIIGGKCNSSSTTENWNSTCFILLSLLEVGSTDRRKIACDHEIPFSCYIEWGSGAWSNFMRSKFNFFLRSNPKLQSWDRNCIC